MPPEVHAPFDHTVIEVIEHSPTGAVPYTPAYRDALARLYSAHQVYPSADHKGGHVTARSLAGKPSVVANNLEVLAAGQEELLETNASIFSRYVKTLPAEIQSRAESLRAMVAGRPALHRAKHGGVVAHDPIHSLFFVAGAGAHPGLPGNYLYGFIAEASSQAGEKNWTVQLHDSEDGAVLYHAASAPDAVAKVQELIECAPFDMKEIEALGFQST